MNLKLVHSGALGDTLLLIPLLRALRRRFPAAARTVVSHPGLGQLLVHLGHAEAAGSVDSPEHSRWFAARADEDSAGEGSTFDSPLPAPGWAQCDLLLSAVAEPSDPWAQHARAALARHNPHARLLFFSPRPPADYPHHVTLYQREQLAALELPGVPPGKPGARCDGPVNPIRLNTHGPIVIHPGSGSPAKNWPLGKFLAVGWQLAPRAVTFLLGPAEIERLPPTALAAIRREFPTLESPSLIALADFLATAGGYLGNDAGPTHLAAALGLPTCVLFGPSNWQTWHPIGPAVHILPAAHLPDLPIPTVLARLCDALQNPASSEGCIRP